MWNWIVQNKQWVFSGAGILIITAIWEIVKRLVRRKPSPLPVPQPTSNSVIQAPVINVAPVINLPHQASSPQEPKLDTTTAQQMKYKQARDLIAAIGEVRIIALEAKTAAELLDAKADSLAGGRGEYARVCRVAPTEHNRCISTLIRLQSAISAAKQCLVQARNTGLFGEETDAMATTVHSNLDNYLRSVEAACVMDEPPHYMGNNIEYRAKRELRWEQIAELLREAEQQNPQDMLSAMTRQQDDILQKSISETDAFEIIFDPENPGRQFWSHRTIESFSSQTHGIEYRVKIRNKTQKTLREVKATTETLGPLGSMPVRLIFDQTGKDTFALDPGASAFVKLFFTSLPLTQPGTLMGSSTAAYGPIKVTISALDTRAVEKVFRFNPLRMDFNPEKESLIY